jgi:hypothetical protein
LRNAREVVAITARTGIVVNVEMYRTTSSFPHMDCIAAAILYLFVCLFVCLIN